MAGCIPHPVLPLNRIARRIDDDHAVAVVQAIAIEG
jgi:hypothetical protein